MHHPKGLYLLFTVEMWERFSYYGMRALLVLYLTAQYLSGGLGFSDKDASLIYGIFTGLVYFTPLIGGYIADNFVGQRKSIVIGSLLMIAGHLSLASVQALPALYIGLTLLILGNGMFKPNISVMVGGLYPDGDSRRDSAFTIFYMGINLGSFFAPIVTGWLAVNYGYRYGFLAAATGLTLGLLNYIILGRKLLGNVGMKASGAIKEQGKEAHETKLTPEEKNRVKAVVILTSFAIVFFAGYEQAGCSMTLFTEHYLDRNVNGFEVPTAWFQSLNPLMILILAPLLSMFWGWLDRKGLGISIPRKMGHGLILLGLGFNVLIFALLSRGGDVNDLPDTSVKSPMWFMIAAYFLHTVGELCLSPIGLSMVSRLAPVKYASLFMGVWLASSAVANFFAGYLSSLTDAHGFLEIYLLLAVVSILLGVILTILNKPLLKLGGGKL
ncbi:MAG: peptide MFS transporter [Paludibacteraceae bacterium]|nr:peptide MFS transporter [Paludibacteraceae bacterium]MBO7368120.1 peptide MFS transporter [Paludibacteraceae bacterium]